MRLFFLNLTTFIKGNRVENPTRLGHVIQSICCSSKITPLGMPFICKKFFPIISNVNFGRPNFPSVTPTKRTTTKTTTQRTTTTTTTTTWTPSTTTQPAPAEQGQSSCEEGEYYDNPTNCQMYYRYFRK